MRWRQIGGLSSIVLSGTMALLISGSGCRTPQRYVTAAPPRPVKAAPIEDPKIPLPDPLAADVPPGYRVEVVASGLTFPSSIEFDDSGTLYIAEAGYVCGDIAAPARVMRVEKDGRIEVVADQLNGPITDLLWHGGQLYISHRGKISVLVGNEVQDIVTGLPSQGDCQNNQISAGPDGKLYVGQGTASNSGVVGVDNYVFGWLGKHPNVHDLSPFALELRETQFESLNPLKLSTDKEKLNAVTGPFQPFGQSGATIIRGTVKANGTILRFNPDGSGLEVYAWGLRNPFGVAWGLDGILYVTEDGYDDRGSRPIANAPDVVWQITQDAWYGFPDFAGGVPVTDPQFKPAKGPVPEFLLKQHPRRVEKPLAKLPPHSGVGKMDFSRSSQFGFEGQMFVAEVGDMKPITGKGNGHAGYQVVRIDLTTGETTPFFRTRAAMLGAPPMEYVSTSGPKRPVDVRFSRESDALYIADLGAVMVYQSATPAPRPFAGSGVIWRISRETIQPGFPIGISFVPGRVNTAIGGAGTLSGVQSGGATGVAKKF